MSKNGRTRRNLILFSTALAFCAAVDSSCTKPKPTQPTTSIVVAPPDVKIERVKVGADKEGKIDPASHEIAHTDWMFSIKPELDFSIKDEKQDKRGYHLILEVTGVKLNLALPIKMTVSQKAPQSVLDHENGHVEICRRAYANAREYALDAVNKALGKRFDGFGSDRKLALSNALEMAAQEIASSYRTKTAAVAENVSSIYDQLCEKEDRDKLVEKTVEEAFVAVRKEEEKLEQSRVESKAGKNTLQSSNRTKEQTSKKHP